MSVVESTHEQSLVIESKCSFLSNLYAEISTLFLVMLGYGETDLSLDCNDLHTMMIRVK
jgi:hypothetical protein